MEKLNKKISIITIFSKFIYEHPKEFFLLFIFLLFEGFIASISIISIAPLADYLIDPNLQSPNFITKKFLQVLSFFNIEKSLLIFSMFFIISNLIKGIFEIGIMYFVLKIKYKVHRYILSDLLKTFFESNWTFFGKSEKGVLLNSFNRELTVIGDTLGHITMQFAQCVQIIIYIIIPVWINPIMTISAIFIAISLSIPFLMLHKLSYSFGKLNTETANKVMKVISEIFNGARIIIGFSKQSRVLTNYQNAFDSHVSATIKSQILGQTIQSLYNPIGIIACTAALSISIYSGDKLSTSAIVLWSLFRVMPLIGMVLRSNVSISNFIPSFEQIQKLKQDAINYKEINGPEKFTKIKKSINFKNVSFSYQNRNKVLEGLNMEFKKNKLTAIVGESGSGKSTILDLILGFQSPSKGEIYFDENKISNINMISFRKKIGYVPQDSYIFSGTIRENLIWPVEEISERNIIKACKLAGAYEFISELPDGLDTFLGDNASLFSGGQKQRISLARALIKNPEIIILDEATSALDVETENEIKKIFNNFENKITSIIVTHRFSTISNADNIYVIQKGKIADQGSFRDLSSKKEGVFYKMLSLQKGEKIK